jgi:hypothetical protein
MKKIYESFREIAKDFVNGDSWTHTVSSHTEAECLTWQNAIFEFCNFLDTAGVKIVANPEIYEKLWENIRTLIPGDSYYLHNPSFKEE